MAGQGWGPRGRGVLTETGRQDGGCPPCSPQNGFWRGGDECAQAQGLSRPPRLCSSRRLVSRSWYLSSGCGGKGFRGLRRKAPSPLLGDGTWALRLSFRAGGMPAPLLPTRPRACPPLAGVAFTVLVLFPKEAFTVEAGHLVAGLDVPQHLHAGRVPVCGHKLGAGPLSALARGPPGPQGPPLARTVARSPRGAAALPGACPLHAISDPLSSVASSPPVGSAQHPGPPTHPPWLLSQVPTP